MLKKLFHKLLFITPLFGLIFSCINGINATLIGKCNKTIIVYAEKNELKALSFYQGIEENNDFSDFFFTESELEDDFEFNGLKSNYEAYTSSVTENQKLYNKTSFCLLQKSTPLYDLFCNWKHHLS